MLVGQINFSGASYITYMRQMPTRYVDIRDNPGIVFCESFSEEFSTLTELRLQHSSIGGNVNFISLTISTQEMTIFTEK